MDKIPTRTRIPISQTSGSQKRSLNHVALGSQLLNRYEVFGIRKGGMGIVYYVEDNITGEKYAVKTLKNYPQKSMEIMKQKFLNEAETLSTIPPHINIVKPYSIEYINERPYLFMEYIPLNLRDQIGRMSLQQITNIAYQVCLAMEFVNSSDRKIVHADLKPENILITSEGLAKVCDFGVAGFWNLFEGKFVKQMAGSIPYMSPEQIRGEVLDERSDIFSYGVMFYEILTGRLPYPFETKNLNHTEWRKRLEYFYGSIDFYNDNYTPWQISENKTISYDLWRLVMGCMFPYRFNRWKSFERIYQVFEKSGLAVIQDSVNERIAVEDLRRKALLFFGLGHLQEALDILNEAILRAPEDARTWQDAANVAMSSGNIYLANKLTKQAKNLDSEIDKKPSKFTSTKDLSEEVANVKR